MVESAKADLLKVEPPRLAHFPASFGSLAQGDNIGSGLVSGGNNKRAAAARKPLELDLLLSRRSRRTHDGFLAPSLHLDRLV